MNIWNHQDLTSKTLSLEDCHVRWSWFFKEIFLTPLQPFGVEIFMIGWSFLQFPFFIRAAFYRFLTRITPFESKLFFMNFQLNSSFFLFFIFFLLLSKPPFKVFDFDNVLLTPFRLSIFSPYLNWLGLVTRRHPFRLGSMPSQRMPSLPHMDIANSVSISFWDLANSIEFFLIVDHLF